MSWLYSRALVEASLAGISLDGAPCALWSGTPTPQVSWFPDKTTEPLRLSRSGMTCRRLTDTLGADVLTWCLGDSRARTSAPQDVAPALTGPHQECGATWRESSVRYDRDTSSWKTHRCLWVEDLPESSVTLPRSGTMLDGVCWERLTPELPTSVTGSGLSLPTPTASSAGTNRSASPGAAIRPTLETMARRNLWPTPTVNDAHNSTLPISQTNRDSIPGAMLRAGTLGGQLNPTWVEWLMGWPLGWTALDASATDKFQEWCASHGAL